MIIFNDHTWQTSSNYLNTNYLRGVEGVTQPQWVVPDNTELANKIISTFYWEPVEDDSGNLIDIIPVNLPVTDKERILSLKNQLEELDRQAIRPLRAIAAGTDTEEDREILTNLEQQAEELRSQISELENNTGKENT